MYKTSSLWNHSVKFPSIFNVNDFHNSRPSNVAYFISPAFLFRPSIFHEGILQAIQTGSVFDREENIAVKEENAGYQHYFLIPQCFQKSFFFSRVVRSPDCVAKGYQTTEF